MPTCGPEELRRTALTSLTPRQIFLKSFWWLFLQLYCSRLRRLGRCRKTQQHGPHPTPPPRLIVLASSYSKHLSWGLSVCNAVTGTAVSPPDIPKVLQCER